MFKTKTDGNLDALIFSIMSFSISPSGWHTSAIKITASDRYNNKAYIVFDGAMHQEISETDIISVQVSEKYVSIYTLGNFGQFEKVDKKLKSR